MMKSRILFLFLVIFLFDSHLSFCQTDGNKTMSDSIILRVAYSYTQRSKKIPGKIRTDTLFLDIGNIYSKYYDYSAERKDLQYTKALMSIKSIIPPDNDDYDFAYVSTDGKSLIIQDNFITAVQFKDRLKQKIYTIDKAFVPRGPKTNIIFEEPLALQNWVIGRDTCRILDYLCTKATTEFRGRIYNAYFTTEIPIAEGPWKLCGLPGTILKADTQDGLFSFDACGIEKLRNKEIILFDGQKKMEKCKSLKDYYTVIRINQKHGSVGVVNGDKMISYTNDTYGIFENIETKY